MKKVNFEAIKEHVSTHYGDLTGVIQIDGHSNISSIYDLCADYNFDTKDKFIIGFGLGESTTNGIGNRDDVYCYILFVDKAEYGDTFEKIESKVQNEGTLKLKKKVINIKYSSLVKYIKRYKFLATSSLAKHVTSIEIEEQIV